MPNYLVTGGRRADGQFVRYGLEWAENWWGTGSFFTGCASGADSAAVSFAVRRGLACTVFAVGRSDGVGFPSCSGFRKLRRLPVVDVWWLAGGDLSIPLSARLAKRSLVCVGEFISSGGGISLAFPDRLPPRPFRGVGVWRTCGSGTWSTVVALLQYHLTVYVFHDTLPDFPFPVAVEAIRPGCLAVRMAGLL